MSQLDHHGTKELAAFIRDGVTKRTDQAFGDYFTGQNASCALGAAYEAMYRLPRDGAHPTRDLDWFFDCLDTVKACPAEGCKKKLFLAAILVHLNDDHRWSRERIADWLEKNGNGSRPVEASPAGTVPPTRE